MQTDKKFYNAQAEKEMLACVLVDNVANPFVTEDIMAKVKVDDFFCNEYKIVYTLMQKLFRAGKEINIVTLWELLDRQSPPPLKMEELVALADKVLPNNSNYQTTIDILKENARLRKLKNLATQFDEKLNTKDSSLNIMKAIQGELVELEESEIVNFDIEHADVSSKKELERIDQIIMGKHDDFGLPTGFPVLDKTLWGLQKSDLIILGARAGVGKTAFALNVLNHCANELKRNCLFFSLEMPKNQIIQRLYSLIGGVDNYDIKKATPLGQQPELLKKIDEKIANGSLYIDDTSKNTVASMSIKAKRFQRKNGLDLVVIDYLQFITPSQRTGNRFQDVGDIARDLKVMARQLNVPVIALCQLNRQLDNEKRTPTLADLRESGEIENNADIIMFLHSTDSKYNEKRNIDLIIGKFRSGQMRAVKMEYEGKCFRFKELEKEPVKKPTTKQTSMELTPIEDDGSLPF